MKSSFRNPVWTDTLYTVTELCMQDMHVHNVRYKRYASSLTRDHVSITFMTQVSLDTQGNVWGFFIPRY